MTLFDQLKEQVKQYGEDCVIQCSDDKRGPCDLCKEEGKTRLGHKFFFRTLNRVCNDHFKKLTETN